MQQRSPTTVIESEQATTTGTPPVPPDPGTIPRALAAPAPGDLATARDEDAGAADTDEARARRGTARILVVEDSRVMRAMLVAYLAQAGYTDVTTADSGASAFGLLGLGDDRPGAAFDLILMDLVLPDADGIDAIRAIGARDDLRKVPVIAVTAMREVAILQTAFEAGASDYLTKPVDQVELLARVGSALRLKREIDRREDRERQLVETQAQLEEANRQLSQLSLTDGLTGVANRRHFDRALLAEWDRAARDREPVTLLMIDIDHFKRYNDTFGHQSGDRCLQRIAATIAQAAMRPGDLLARYGGEEFAIILPRTDARGGQFVAERLRAAIAELAIPHSNSPVAPTVTLSIGVATTIPNLRADEATLLASADRALYEAKEQGRNRVAVTTA